MAVTLLNSYIALRNPESFAGNEGVMKGIVVLVGAGITGIAVNDVIFYPRNSGKEIRYNGQEYIIIKQVDVIGKVS